MLFGAIDLAEARWCQIRRSRWYIPGLLTKFSPNFYVLSPGEFHSLLYSSLLTATSWAQKIIVILSELFSVTLPPLPIYIILYYLRSHYLLLYVLLTWAGSLTRPSPIKSGSSLLRTPDFRYLTSFDAAEVRDPDASRPREAPLYVSGNFAYFWGQNGWNPCGKLHIFDSLGGLKWGTLGVYCIFLSQIRQNFCESHIHRWYQYHQIKSAQDICQQTTTKKLN
jgi:hypothetical protein